MQMGAREEFIAFISRMESLASLRPEAFTETALVGALERELKAWGYGDITH